MHHSEYTVVDKLSIVIEVLQKYPVMVHHILVSESKEKNIGKV
jgi:hypothetical protein